MTRKELKQSSLKKSKLEKTRGRRKALAREREKAQRRGGSRRNDLSPELEIKYLAIAELESPKNRTRKDNPEQIERLMASIVEFGFSQSILVRGSIVLDGWIRLLAARELGLERVPAIDCSHLDEAQARTLALACNRLGERGEWDLDALSIEFEDLINLDMDLDPTGFSAEEQDIILLDALGDGVDDELDAIEEPPANPVTRVGDLWQLGDHRLICGNALEEDTYKELLGDERCQAVLTDPPYNVEIGGNVSGLGKKTHDEFVMASGEMSDEEFQSFLDRVIAMMAAWLVVGSVLFVFMDWRSIHRVYAAAGAARLAVINLAVWYKETGGMGGLYRSAHELVAVLCKGDRPRANNVELGRHGRDRTNVWVAPGANRRGSSANAMLDAHATPKPVELCVDALLDVTQRGDLVLDAFLGSGATLIAAEKSGRRCRGIELEPGFVDVCIRRWEQHTGDFAVLVTSGETFAEVERVRNEASDMSDEGEAA